jgi:DNA-binding NarL/FixJ family response regulator
MSGIETARKIRTINRAIKIVVLSKHDPVQIAASAETANVVFDAYLCKTSSGTELKSVLAAFDGVLGNDTCRQLT